MEKKNAFKVGDKVVRVSTNRGFNSPLINIVLTIEKLSGWDVYFFKGESTGCYEEDLISEDIYNSQLYQALKENND